jgi:C-terminal binding protein
MGHSGIRKNRYSCCASSQSIRIFCEPSLLSIKLIEQVVFFDPRLPNGAELALGITRVRDMNQLYSRSDIISLHCSHNPSTHRLINKTSLSAIKPSAILINTARGELVDLSALENALRTNQLAAAGIDVIETEPPQEPLPGLIKAYREREGWLMGRLVITPHAAWYSPESLVDMRVKSAETMRDVLFDGMETNVIDPDSW